MTDISKCTGDGCPIKESCKRFRVPAAEHRQTFFTIPPYNHDEKKCDYFWQWLEYPITERA
jgi:hypothetical protein